MFALLGGEDIETSIPTGQTLYVTQV